MVFCDGPDRPDVIDQVFSQFVGAEASCFNGLGLVVKVSLERGDDHNLNPGISGIKTVQDGPQAGFHILHCSAVSEIIGSGEQGDQVRGGIRDHFPVNPGQLGVRVAGVVVFEGNGAQLFIDLVDIVAQGSDGVSEGVPGCTLPGGFSGS